MLILAKITSSSAGGYAGYLAAKTQTAELGDYYLKDGERTETPGRWAGGAQLFGIDSSEAVTEEQLHTLMDVRRPDTGDPLRRAGGTGEAVSAIDATFSAPKSVSATWALASPEVRASIERAHEQAVDRALAYATRQVPMLRRRISADQIVHEKASGMVATSWRHTTARAVDEQVPDPQLHSHVLLHAAVRKDGEVVAIDSRSWLVHQREVGAAYRTELAHELAELGFGIRRGTGRGGRYFEIDGIPQPLIDRWSSRHHQVRDAIQTRLDRHDRELAQVILQGGPAAIDAARQREALRESGQLSPAEDRLMGKTTRNAKTPTTTTELDTEWQLTAGPLGASRERIEVLRHSDQSLRPATADQVLKGLTEFDATFPARDARAVALERSAGTPIKTSLDQLQQLRERDEILLLADGSGTTQDHRGRERAVVTTAQRLAESRVPPIPEQAAQNEADRLDQELGKRGGRLSDEQRAAITVACGDRPLVVIEGQAGTGKSTALIGIARAHQEAGRQIIVTSTAALAAERLAGELNEHGVHAHAYSTAALDSAIAHGTVQLDSQSTVIHDEAALASTREQLQLLHAIEQSGGRLIAVGDPQQNQPVGAGGLWDYIEDEARQADAHVELTHNQRARDPADRRDQARFRNGQIELAIRGYAARDHLHLTDNPQHAEDQALDAAHADRTRDLNTIVIAQTSNDHLDQLNARAQAIRRQAGQLGDEHLPVTGRPYAIHPGDDIQIRRTLPHPHGPLPNGTTGHVQDIDPEAETAEIRLPDGRHVQLDARQIDQADLRLAYVQHPFPAQGQTTDTAHLIVGDHATRDGTYVAITRARQTTNVYAAPPHQQAYTDRIVELAEQASRTEPEVPSVNTPVVIPCPFGRVARAADSVRQPQTAGMASDDTTDKNNPEHQHRTRPIDAESLVTRQRSSERGRASVGSASVGSADYQDEDPGGPGRSQSRNPGPAGRRIWPSGAAQDPKSEREANEHSRGFEP